MKWLSTPEFKVGLLVLIVSGIIAGMSLVVSSDANYLGSNKDAWFYIDDASGLVKNSGVRMAGIQVGIIKDVKFDNGQARIDMILQGDLPITKSARIEIRPNGILGDKHVEIISGDPRDPPLQTGEQILVVDDRASVDRLISEVSKITKSLSDVADNIRAATEGDSDKPLGRIISNLQRITTDVAEISSKNKEEIGRIVRNVDQMTSTLNSIVNQPGPDGLKASLRDAVASLRKIEGTIRNVEEITGKINRGEGTIGKLVNDEATIDEVNTAVSGINQFLDAGNKMQTVLDFHSNYLLGNKAAKSFLSLQVQPGLDRYYEVGIVDDARGVTTRTITTTTPQDPSGTSTTVREDKRFENRVKFNLLFAKNFYDFTLRGGVMENAGGVGADYHMLRRRLRLTVDAFDFANLNLRVSARYSIFHGIYFSAGAEDLLSRGVTGGRSGFVGAGLFLTNDDLRLLLGAASL